MRHFIEKLITPNLGGNVDPDKLKAAKIITEVMQNLENETRLRVYAENIYDHEIDFSYAYKEAMNRDYALNCT